MTIDAKQTSETDLSVYVLALLDDHLSAMHEIRERMRIGTTTALGARHALALDSITTAEAYADALSRALVHSSPPAKPAFLA
jgi:hypothetical protein